MFSVWARVLRPTPPACPIAIQWVQSIPLSRRSNRGERRRARRKLHATFWFESRSKVSKPLLGSVAEQVLRSVNLPVITVGPEAHLAVDVAAQEGIVLHATTLREASRPSAVLACKIASAMKRSLVLLHVLPPKAEMEHKGLPTGADSLALRELRAIAEETGCGCSMPIEPHVVHGNPAIEILAEAAERHACLIVLGAAQRNVFQNLTRERTIYKVLAHARCPVVTLREPKAETEETVLARLATHI